MQPMLRALLKDRFELTTHQEMQQMPAYDLVVAKGGVKMSVYPKAERPLQTYGVRYPSMMRGTGTASELADMLSRVAGRPVFDRTGLTDRYNYGLVYAPLSLSASSDSSQSGPPDLLTAVQEQLGLKLEPNKENVEVIVIDHIERVPSEN
jgi:uncharacterized protein (TIGR03435 family)